MGRGMIRRFILVVLAIGALCLPTPSEAAQDGLVTRTSNNSVPVTVSRFGDAVRAAGWVVFAQIDHAAAAQAAGLSLPPRTVLLFGNPVAGTPAMAAHPTLAIDLPMRVLVWADERGRTFVTRSTGEDIGIRVFARHGIAIPPDADRRTDSIIEGFVRSAVEKSLP